jgi:hypothetical protein
MSQESFILSSQRKAVDLKKTQSVEHWIEISADTNLVPGFLSYTDDFEGWLSRAPSINSPHPDYPPLRLKKIRGERQEGYIVKVSLWYESWSIEASYPGRPAGSITRNGGEVSVSEEPILTNKLFDGFAGEEEISAINEYLASGRTPADYNKLSDAISETAGGMKALELLSKGVEAYLNPGAIHTQKLTGVKLEAFNLGQVGKIDSPSGAPGIGDRTWLYIGATYDENDDGTYSGTRRWQASEEGGWDEELYGEGE